MLKKASLLLVVAVLAVHAPLSAETSAKGKKAEKLIAAGDVPGAMVIYKELIEKNAVKNPDLVREGREGMAKCKLIQAKDQLKNSNYAEAEKILKETIADYKDTTSLNDAFATLVQVRARVCAALYDAGKYEECVAIARDSRSLVPAETDGLKELSALSAKSLFANGSKSYQAKDYAPALKNFAAVGKGDLAKDDPLLAQSSDMIAKIGKELLALAESQIKAGKYDDAAKNIELALTASSDDAFVAQAKYDTGLANRLNNQPDKALASYKEVLDSYKATAYAPMAAYDMYLINTDRGNRKDALASITAAVSFSPDNIDYLFIRAGLLKDTGAADEAKKVYLTLVDVLQNKIQKTFTEREKLQYRLGQAYLNLESYAEASVEFDKAITRNPSYTEARKGLAFAQFQDKNYADASQNYELLIKQGSDDLAKLRDGSDPQQMEKLSLQIAYYHYQNGLCCEQMGNFDKAEQECRLGLEGVPTKEAAVTLKRIQQAKAQKAAAAAAAVPVTPAVPAAPAAPAAPAVATPAATPAPATADQPK